MLSDIYIKPDFRIFRFSRWHLIVPVVIGLLMTLISYPAGFLSVKVMSFVLFYSLALGIPSMKCFEYIEWKLERYIPWLEKPNLRFFMTAFLEISACIIVLIGINFLVFIVIQKQEIGILYSKTYGSLKYLFITAIIGIFLINSSFFFKSWRQSAVNEEKLKREKLAIEYESLKNQVNPHFLFNNLTALSSLVYTDQEKAVMFIREFSNVFRYVLESREKEAVDYATEKKLLESVSYLYRIRYENSLTIEIRLPDATDKFIIPMALQMLVENAIKHNSLSGSSPLVITIGEEDDYVVVRNNRQPKMSEIVSSRIGLENIRSRYKYLSGREVLVEVNEKEYTVKIPVLNLKNVQDADY